MFNFFKNTLARIYQTVSAPLQALFAKKIDTQAIQELKNILLEADVGPKITAEIIQEVTTRYQQGSLTEGKQLKDLLETTLIATIQQTPEPKASEQKAPCIILLVGINGSGKTTCAAKLAHYYQQQHKKVLLVAADTFRAAAVDQLVAWATRTNTALVFGAANQDPAAVVFKGCQQFKHGDASNVSSANGNTNVAVNNAYDVLIIDTAGRLQTKSHLMQELAKIKKVIAKNLPDEQVTVLLTVDAMLGQNSFDQAKVFHEATEVQGLLLTKLDGTGKGGIVFHIMKELHIPIAFISFGEKLDDFAPFDAHSFVQRLLE